MQLLSLTAKNNFALMNMKIIVVIHYIAFMRKLGSSQECTENNQNFIIFYIQILWFKGSFFE